MVNRRSLTRMEVSNPDGGGGEPSAVKRRPRIVHNYGDIPGEEVGKIYKSRENLGKIHRPERNWIHLGPEGPYSLIIRGRKRFYDEGALFIIFTKEDHDPNNKKSARNTIIGNLIKGVKGRLPIRVVRYIKTDRNGKPIFRYDGLYIMVKKLLYNKKLHFLLKRVSGQPKLMVKKRSGPSKIKQLLKFALRLKMKKNEMKKNKVKQELYIKNESPSNSYAETDERDSTTQSVELTWEELKQELASLGGDSVYRSDNGAGVWLKGDYSSPIKLDFDEIYDDSASNGSVEPLNKYGVCYNDDQDVVVELHPPKKEIVYENVLCPKSEDSSNDKVSNLIAYLPETKNSELKYLEENSNTNLDPPCDPLGSCGDESKISDCSDEIINTHSDEVDNSCSDEINDTCSDEITNSSQEVKTSDDEKKSGKLCEYSDKHQFLSIMEHSHNVPCLYDFTIRHLICFLGNWSDNSICPCRSSPKCAAQKNFEVTFQSLLNEARLKSCDPKCLKSNEENSENSEIKDSSILSNLYDLLTDLIYSRRSDVRTPSNTIVQKQQQIIRSTKLQNKETSTKNCRSKQILSVKESSVPSSVEDHSLPSNVDESLVPSSEFLAQSYVEEEPPFVPSEVSPCTNPAYRAISPLPDNTTIRLESNKCTENPTEEHNQNKRRGRRKGMKNLEASQLGPVISNEEESALRDTKLKKSYKGSSFYVTPRHSLSRAAKRVHEEEDKFLGFFGPIRPSKKLRLIRAYLKTIPDDSH